MSLVSAIPDRDRQRPIGTRAVKAKGKRTPGSSRTSTITSASGTSSLTRDSRRSPVYRPTGTQLSKEALYRAKLKYGVYQSPATQYTVGVTDVRASADTAAVLASGSHVNMETYERKLDPNATKAASAVGARTKSMVAPAVDPPANSQRKAGAAASKAYSMTNVSRETATPGKDSDRAVSLTAKANMRKVFSNASKKAESNVRNRMEPERGNFSYGIKTQAAEHNQFKFDKEMMGNIMAKTEKAASLQQMEQQKVDDRERTERGAKFALNAAVSVKDLGPSVSREIDDELAQKRQQRNEYLRQLTSTKVMAMAQNRVNAQLRDFESGDTDLQLWGNESYNKAAVAIAHTQFRNKPTPRDPSKVNMGGGLWLSQADIQKISQDLLNPILGEIDERAAAQRKADDEISDRTKAYNENLTNWKNMQVQKEKNDVQIVKNAEKKYANDKLNAKNAAEEKFNEMVKRMEARLKERNKDLDDTKQAYEDLKEEISMKLEMEQERADKEVASWAKYREKDIDVARDEQENLLKPYRDDLAAAETEQEALITNYDAINEEIVRLNSVVKHHKSKIEEYTGTLESQGTREQRELTLIDDLDGNRGELETDMDEQLIIRANKAREEAELATKEARLKQLEVEAAINERRTELNQTDIDLQKEKLNLLEAMQLVAEARGDEKLDEERIKTLFGMTSEEYIDKNMLKPKVSKKVEEKGEKTSEKSAEKSTKKSAEKPTKKTSEKPVEKPATKPAQKPAAKPAQKPAEKAPKSGLKNFFLGGSTNTATKPAAAAPAAAKEPAKESAKTPAKTPISSSAAPAAAEPASKELDSDDLAPTFSGFSQGSINGDKDGQGYFKEVF
ncbi:Eis1p KNAG_0M02260 [Huiozyma naganishii CBS 8797]|uniref:Eisosome protein 1 n=1 Tax=Huiozyma naganishii (strain ATCC MYA-139 / BCRC 22969 / CBS 8797 / KCTC 17520 / NBRC 10181 / NCYC 3082 / Yp74L-3) TaxID=1071383 RepID=J7SAV2_HUIN7|nr:hypothetical protein KNAG_0M02260 [Kazachstania naganishii CBS 8797]CCK73079.1 hypothetical protein KNAG_0M02260 [Kazachstania naganishii CBS 8797]